MTTKKDNLKKRVNSKSLGIGQELTVGVPDNGMQNASGDYPKREYNFGSSINQGALGTKIHKLYTGGGESEVPLNIPEQMPSQYPFSQVDETPSGHVIEMDDTPGGERVLIKHRKGSGVELRADGSVVISALNNKVEVTGGDQTVIVEGHGSLVYNGNLNLKVSGDMNIDVGGDYNVQSGGNSSIKTRRDHLTEVSGDAEYKFLKTKTEKVQSTHTAIRLGDDTLSVKGKVDYFSEGDMDFSTKSAMLLSGSRRLDIVGNNIYAHAVNQLKLAGLSGMIGGPFMRFTGQTYSGAIDADDGSAFDTAIFHGTLHGTATKAIHASKANSSTSALIATNAVFAERSGWAASISSSITGVSTIPATGPGLVTFPTAPSATPAPVVVTSSVLSAAASAIQGFMTVSDMLTAFPVEVDGGHVTVEAKDLLKIVLGEVTEAADTPINLLGKPKAVVLVDAGDHVKKDFKGLEHYRNGVTPVFRAEPTISEIRSAFRNKSSRQASKTRPSEVGVLLIAEGKLNHTYMNPIPPGNLTGRTVAEGKSNSKYGYTPIGNSIENKGKRFRK